MSVGNVGEGDSLAGKFSPTARDSLPPKNAEKRAPFLGEDCETSSLQAMTSPNIAKAPPISVEPISHEFRTESPSATKGSPEELRAMEKGSSDTPDTSTQYPTGLSMVFITVSLMMGVFMIALDTTIICEYVCF
jgi:hypothetical protein